MHNKYALSPQGWMKWLAKAKGDGKKKRYIKEGRSGLFSTFKTDLHMKLILSSYLGTNWLLKVNNRYLNI